MERVISDEERIRRAEDILERRKNTDLRISSNSFGAEKSNNKIRKMLVQILICLIIYCGFYYIKNSKSEKTNSFIQNINVALQQDTDFKSMYSFLYEKFNSLTSKNTEQSTENNNNVTDNENNNSPGEPNSNEQENNASDTQNEDKQENNAADAQNEDMQENNSADTQNENMQERKTSEEQESADLGIGGGFEETASSDEDQMTVDAQYILKNFKIINPLENGIVTSKFGIRDSSSIVSGNHKGIDLGAKTGSAIISAEDGIVIEASSVGDYGMHIKVKKEDMVIIYAHCSKLLVNEGDSVTKGQKIAEVGSTGKATGPHLHFEIRREERPVNPELVLEF